MLHCNNSFLQVIFLHLQLYLKVTYYTNFEVHNLFWVTTRIGLHSLMFKKHISFLIPSSAAALYPPSF